MAIVATVHVECIAGRYNAVHTQMIYLAMIEKCVFVARIAKENVQRIYKQRKSKNKLKRLGSCQVVTG